MKYQFTGLLSLFFMMITEVTPIAGDRVILASGEWPPYLSEHLPNYGAASYIVEKAFNAVGIEVEYFFRPWVRSYRYAEQGNAEGNPCHGTVVWVYATKRAESFNYSDVVIEDTEVLFHLKENPLKWSTVEDLKGKIIGGTLHTAYPIFEKAESKGILTIQRAGNYDTLFQRLLAGRIDAVPQVKHVGQHFIETSLSEDEKKHITFSETVVCQRNYHLIFSKIGDADQRYLKLFNKGLRIIREDGTYNRIMQDLDIGTYYIK